MGHRKPFVAANWKLHGSRSQLEQFTGRCLERIDERVDVVLCPSHVHLDFTAALLNEQRGDEVGAQNEPAQTRRLHGEVSCEMLVEAGCQYVLVGHSERRRLFGETSFIVAGEVRGSQSGRPGTHTCLGESGRRGRQEEPSR